MKGALAAIIASFLAFPAFADGHASGDAAAGEKGFNKCKSCHMIADADGNTIVRGGKTGPNLFGLPGRTAGMDESFKRYKKDLVAAGEAGLVWDEAEFVAYVADPKSYLRERLGDDKANSGMTFRLKDAKAAADIWAYIASVSPQP